MTDFGLGCTSAASSHTLPCPRNPTINALNEIANPKEEVNVYVNSISGDDSNIGSTSFPVKTIDGAIHRLKFFSASCANIILSDGVHDIGTDPVLDFFPISGRYGQIYIKGSVNTLTTDTILTTGFDGPGQQWISVTGTTAGYTPGAFDYKFFYNEVTKKYATIKTNTATVLTTLLGFLTPLVIPYTEDGQAYTIFDLDGTGAIIQSKGRVQLRIHPQAQLIFERVTIDPLATVTPPTSINEFPYWIAPPVHDPLVYFRGCQLNARGSIGCYSEAYIIEGCRIQGFKYDPFDVNEVVFFNFSINSQQIGFMTIFNTIFINTIVGASGTARFDAVIIDSAFSTIGGSSLRLEGGTVNISGIEILNAPGIGVFGLRGVDGIIGPINITNVLGDAIYIDASNSIDIDTLEVTFNPLAAATVVGIRTEDGNKLRLIRCTIPDSPSHGIVLSKGTVFAAQNITITDAADVGMVIERGACGSLDSVSISDSGGIGMLVRRGCKVSGIGLSGTGNVGIGVKVEAGSCMDFIVRPTITGGGGDAQAGSAPISTWAILAARAPGVANDYSLNPTDNCHIYTV